MDQTRGMENPGADASAANAGSDEHAPAEITAAPVAPWLLAGPTDLGNRDFEAPIAGLASAESYELSEAYRLAGQAVHAAEGALDTPEARLFVMLSAVTGMHFNPHERDEPFGPMLAMADGRRSAIPADFRGTHVDLLADMAMRATNPVLRARLADVAWLLDRRRGKLGGVAITAYLDTIEALEAGTLKFPHGDGAGALEQGAREYLYRALHIGRTIGWDKPGGAAGARPAHPAGAASARRRAGRLSRCSGSPSWIFDFGVSDPGRRSPLPVEGVLASRRRWRPMPIW